MFLYGVGAMVMMGPGGDQAEERTTVQGGDPNNVDVGAGEPPETHRGKGEKGEINQRRGDKNRHGAPGRWCV